MICCSALPVCSRSVGRVCDDKAVALWWNNALLSRAYRTKFGEVRHRPSIGPGTGWRFVDDFGREVPPGFYPESEVTFDDAPTEGFAIDNAVANYEGDFTLRKAQVRWARNGGAAGGTDDAVTTHHFIKLSGGTPSDSWVAADFIAVEAAILAFWAAIDAQYSARTLLNQIRWYNVDPEVPLSGPPVRVIDPALPGTQAASTGQNPPQVAISVTEKTSSAPNWGRFYLPAPIDTHSTEYGRIGAANQSAIADAADTMYEAFIAASCPAVVYSSAKPARETKGGTELPAQPARALGVVQIQVDDLYDVIRSRRWNEPLLRLQRDIAGS